MLLSPKNLSDCLFFAYSFQPCSSRLFPISLSKCCQQHYQAYPCCHYTSHYAWNNREDGSPFAKLVFSIREDSCQMSLRSFRCSSLLILRSLLTYFGRSYQLFFSTSSFLRAYLNLTAVFACYLFAF